MLNEKLMEALNTMQNSIRVPQEKFIDTDNQYSDCGITGACLSYCNRSCSGTLEL